MKSGKSKSNLGLGDLSKAIESVEEEEEEEEKEGNDDTTTDGEGRQETLEKGGKSQAPTFLPSIKQGNEINSPGVTKLSSFGKRAVNRGKDMFLIRKC